ncbi:hypothetical protein FRC15_004434 [Serendipita sp. 397]|nr:hypothetical protein FRC15_004434 [Serendipita sp. 397]
MKRMRVPFLIDLLVNTVNYCWRRRSRADPNNFTLFLTHDIMMEDLTAVPDITNGVVGVGKRLPPVRVPPPPPYVPRAPQESPRINDILTCCHPQELPSRREVRQWCTSSRSCRISGLDLQ